MTRYDFLVESYRTERLKTLGVWSQVPLARMDLRAEPRARTPREHMVHQCASEENWMKGMLGIDASRPPLPALETRDAFIEHYASLSAERLAQLARADEAWFEAETMFFDVLRSRAWVLTRRLTHSAHHRGQLNALLRIWGEPLYSVYGPTADTGGLAANGGRVIYRFRSEDDARLGAAAEAPALPGPGENAPTERR
jgi:uncharacterized damage-inducible protein DinB